MSSPAVPPLAISLGDPAGVGPELICEAWSWRAEERLPPFFVVGGPTILKEAAERRGIELDIARIASVHDAGDWFPRALPVLDMFDGSYRPGDPDPEGARLALGSLREAASLAVEGHAGGLVTGPVSKALLAEVGFQFPGQTEFLAASCGMPVSEAVMMLAGPSLRTVPLTVHCALSEVPGLITEELILHRARIVAAALRADFGIQVPRVAVAALNPHAGENGRMGEEEIRTIAPAVAALRAEGIDASGPFAADSLFAPHARGTYDVALAMYHDQALVPLKALDFDSGVNVTLGLPIVRTSADHGTAFAIAGSGQANAGATIAAIRLAGEAAERRARG